jgi:hypothetical protein
VYVERRKSLQEKGWGFGWVRVETWGVDNNVHLFQFHEIVKSKILEEFVHHMPSKYAKSTILAKDNDCIQGIGGSTIECKLGVMPLSLVFLCKNVKPIPLPMWPEGAKLN